MLINLYVITLFFLGEEIMSLSSPFIAMLSLLLPVAPIATALSDPLSRRAVLLPATAAVTGALATPGCVAADTALPSLGYVDDAGMVSYSQVQRAWEKAATMSDTEKMLAAKGVAMPKEGETPRARKRRAMAGCSMDEFRTRAGFGSAADCNTRVLGGELEQILAAMDAS